ncbi:MAG: glycosyltransferase family 4 protein [Candidatus Hermodarchaeota archaeon]
MKTQNILFITKYVAGGLPGEFTYHGEWTDTFELILALKKRNPRLNIFLLTPKIKKTHRKRFWEEFGIVLKENRIKHYLTDFYLDHNIPFSYFRFKMFLAEMKIIRKEKIDVIQYGQFSYNFIYVFKRKFNIKIISYGCYDGKKDWEGKRMDEEYKKQLTDKWTWNELVLGIVLLGMIKLFRITLFDKKQDCIVTMHKSGFKLLSQNDYQRIFFIPKGAANPYSFFKIRDKFRNIFFLANLQYRKGIKDFLDVATRFPDISFYIFGVPFSRDIIKMIKRYVRDYPNIEFRGSLGYHEKWNILSEMDLLLYPSYKDTYPSVIMEAMSCGMPVITTLSIDSRVLDGYNGFLCSAGDLNCMIEKIELLQKNLVIYQKMSKNAFETYKKNTWARAAEKFISLYNVI